MSRVRRICAALAVLATVGGTVGGAVTTLGRPAGARQAPAGAAGDAQLRVAHFSPDTPPMDVYVTGFDGVEKLVLPALGFGQVSEYLPLPGGVFAFSMRPAGSPASEEAVLRVSAELADATAYTFAAFGRQAELSTDLLTDDLSAPPAGQGRVRLIQAAGDAGPVDVRTERGPVLARNAELGSVGSYLAVPAGAWKVIAEADEGDEVVEQLDVGAGTVSSLVVLDGSSAGALRIMRVSDATGADTTGVAGASGGAPVGGVPAGAGGTAEGASGGFLALSVSGLALALAALCTLVVVALRARTAARRRLA
jgi:hypothetical protein